MNESFNSRNLVTQMQHNRSIHLFIGTCRRNPYTRSPSTHSHSINTNFFWFYSIFSHSPDDCSCVWKLAWLLHIVNNVILINYSILFWTVLGGASSLINSFINSKLRLSLCLSLFLIDIVSCTWDICRSKSISTESRICLKWNEFAKLPILVFLPLSLLFGQVDRYTINNGYSEEKT